MKKKKTITINFQNFWKDFDPENNLFTNLLRKEYEVVLSNKPDYVFYSVFPEKKNSDIPSNKLEFVEKIFPNFYLFCRKIFRKFKKKKSLECPQGNFVKIFYTGENIKPNMDECDWAFSFYYDEDFKHTKHMRLPNYKFLEEKIDLTKNKKEPLKIIKEKRKFCNFIYSQNIPFRNKFFNFISNYKKIDSPGKCMNNFPPIGMHNSPKNSRLFRGWAKEKIKFLKNYKFTIAFENSSTPGYTTEKIYHAMIANSIPIYFGNPLIARDFNPKSFINCHEFRNFEDVLEKIKEIDNNEKEYLKILKEPWFNENKKTRYVDDKKILNQLIKIIESKNGKNKS